MNQQAKDNAVWAGIAALLMLVYGWRYGTVGISDSGFYNTTVAVFNWMLRIGGIGMAGVAIICFAGLRVGLLIDVLVSGICGLIMVACAGYWLLSGGFGFNDLLFLAFGGMFLNAARGCWSAYAASGPAAVGGASAVGGPAAGGGPSAGRGWLGVKPLQPPKPPSPPEPPHPASVRPKTLPEDGQPPPEGYLAALAKEDDEPPTAAHK
jgi:hypothetical protein